MDRRLLTTQYNTKPEGNQRKKKVKIIGNNFITFACIGSGGVGLSFCCTNILAPIMIGKIKNGSLLDKSVNQNIKGA